MQFNLVISSNSAAVHVWQKLGFAIVGTIPEAFNHRELGYIDAHVMYRSLEGPA
jgi:RimJ/RimL family protein N-acetyltransferase